MNNTYTLFSISTSCLESENVVLHKYVLRRLLQRQVQDIILGYSEPTSTFISYKSIDLCIVESLMMELLMVFILYWRDLSLDVICLPTQWYLDWKRKRCSAVVNFIYKSLKMKITGFW